MNPIPWLVTNLLEQYPLLAKLKVRDHPELSPDKWLALRVKWGLDKGFTRFYGDSRGIYGALLYRPVNTKLLHDSTLDYWTHIWDFDLDGDICGVDHAYGPGLYPQFIKTCIATQKPLIAWRHRNRNHIKFMTDMPRYLSQLPGV